MPPRASSSSAGHIPAGRLASVSGYWQSDFVLDRANVGLFLAPLQAELDAAA